MANLSRGITFTTNDYLTAAKLHALIDTAIAAADSFPGAPTLYNVIMGDFVAGLRAIHTADIPASPATNDLQVGSDGLLNRHNGVAFEDIANNLGYYANNSAITLVTGTPVVPDTDSASGCKLYGAAGTCPQPLGISQTVAAPGATASIAVRGFALALVNNSGFVAIGAHLSLQGAGATGLSNTSSVNTDVMAFAGFGVLSDPSSNIRVVSLVR